MTLELPRISNSAPIVSAGGSAAIYFVKWWNQVCSAIEGAINTLQTQQTQIDQVLGIANAANATAKGASQAATGLVVVGRGGTGETTLAAHAVLLGEGIAPVATAAPGPAGQVLASQGAAADPDFQALAAVLDTSFSSAQGAILYRNATAWVALTPGTAGQTLHTGGAAANPYWA